jgi:hypothetical protein
MRRLASLAAGLAATLAAASPAQAERLRLALQKTGTTGWELAVVKERIWFIKPNLRLRSCVQRRLDGQPLRASFSSEIRRLNRPAP